MPWPPDYHLHTPLCRHAAGAPGEYARRALALGLPEIGFADHAPMPQDDFDDWRMRADQLDQYVQAIRQAQRDCPHLPLRLALEVDYLPGAEAWIRELAARHPWDYLIGSVHYVTDTWAVDNPSRIAEWQVRDPYEVWAAYFERLTQAAETGLFDIIGHVDLPKKFGFRPTRDCTPLFERFVRAARKHRCALELNTAGLRKPCQEIYPSQQILQLAYAQGVPITFGSDAHAPQEVGMHFAEAIRWARATGYRASWRLECRRPRLVRF